jgi:hypothetical protein
MKLSFRVVDAHEIKVTIADMTVDSTLVPSEIEYALVSGSFTYEIKSDCTIEIPQREELQMMLKMLEAAGIEGIEDATKVMQFLMPVQAIRVGPMVLCRPVTISHDTRRAGMVGAHFLRHTKDKTFITRLIDDTQALLEVVIESSDGLEEVMLTILTYTSLNDNEISVTPSSAESDNESIIVRRSFAIEANLPEEHPTIFQLSDDKLSLRFGSLTLHMDPTEVYDNDQDHVRTH